MNKQSITVKIWLSIGVFVLGMVLSTCLGQIANTATERAARVSAQSLFPAAQQAQDAEFAFQRVVKAFGDAVLTQDKAALAQAGEDGQLVVKRLQAIAAIEDLEPSHRKEATQLASSVEQFVTEAQTTYSAVVSAGTNITPEIQGNMQKLAGKTDELKSALSAVGKAASKDLRDQLEATAQRSRSQRWISIAVFVATLVIAGLIVRFTIRRSITGPILRVIYGVQEAADSTAEASARMAESGSVLTSSAQQQLAFIEETSASLEEISAISKENVDRAKHADKLMQNASTTAAQASGAMRDLSASMHAISQSSQQVSDVLKSIDEIAFHTNILALNAAVEAARAGEAGAGFSVVADEVRSLARRAADAARRSGEIVEKTLKDVTTGVQLVSAADQAFQQVSASIGEGSTVASQIATGSQEQARGVAHVSEAISRIEKVTQKNAANAEETAGAASTMSAQVDVTRHHIDELVAVVGLRQQ
jgi:methyl-accepting chemotaxis protein